MEVYQADELEVANANIQAIRKQRDEAVSELQNAQKERSIIERELKNAQGTMVLIQGSSVDQKSYEYCNTLWKKSQNFVAKSSCLGIRRSR
jgi:uncharacterized protein (DUF3084 family)